MQPDWAVGYLDSTCHSLVWEIRTVAESVMLPRAERDTNPGWDCGADSLPSVLPGKMRPGCQVVFLPLQSGEREKERE